MVESIELTPAVREALLSTRNGREALRAATSPSESRGILGTIWDYAKWPLLMAGGLALGSHTGVSGRIPYVGQYLDTAGKWITDTAAPRAGTFISENAQRFWGLLQQGWNGIRGVGAA